jgi:hypothetical protein
MSGADAGERHPGWLDAATAVLLSAAGLVSAWASYQAALWGGIQASNYTIATAKLTAASNEAITAQQISSRDDAMFMAWLDAASTNDKLRMRYYENHFRSAYKAAFEAWRAEQPQTLATSQGKLPSSPAPMPIATGPEMAKAATLRTAANASFATGEAANGHGDRYTMATVALALVLFLGGISPMLKRRGARLGLLVIAAAIGLVAAAYIAALPVATL